MKIRIKGQSVRLRLGRSEVRLLADGDAVAESVFLGTGRFACELRSGSRTDDIAHSYVDGVLSFRIPAGRIDAWANTDAVSLSDDLPVGDGQTLRLLVEKDFVCLDGDGEPDADAFPNPSAACGPIPERA